MERQRQGQKGNSQRLCAALKDTEAETGGQETNEKGDNGDYRSSIKKNVHRDSGMRREMDRR